MKLIQKITLCTLVLSLSVSLSGKSIFEDNIFFEDEYAEAVFFDSPSEEYYNDAGMNEAQHAYEGFKNFRISNDVDCSNPLNFTHPDCDPDGPGPDPACPECSVGDAIPFVAALSLVYGFVLYRRKKIQLKNNINLSKI